MEITETMHMDTARVHKYDTVGLMLGLVMKCWTVKILGSSNANSRGVLLSWRAFSPYFNRKNKFLHIIWGRCLAAWVSLNTNQNIYY